MALRVNRTFKGETARYGDSKEEVWMYDVIADDLTFTIYDAQTADDGVTAVPVKGEPHDQDDEMFVDEVQPSRDEKLPTLIRVTVTFKNNTTVQEVGGGSLEWDYFLELEREPYTETRNIDLDGLAVVNAIGDFYDPFPEYTGSDPVYLYSFKAKNVDWDTLGEAFDCVNDAAVSLTFNGTTKIFPEKTLKVQPDIKILYKIDPDVFYGIKHRLIYKKDGWFTKLVNQGYYYLDGGGKRVRVLDEDKQPSTEPALLAADGSLIAPLGTPVFFPVDGYRFVNLLSFSTLPGFTP